MGAVETLIKELMRIIKEEKDWVKPVVASLYRKLSVLGTLSQQAIDFRESRTFSRDQLRVKYGEFSAAAVVTEWRRGQRPGHQDQIPVTRQRYL